MTLPTYRYQLNKKTSHIVRKGHPWVYRNQLSSAINPIPYPSLLKLYDTDNDSLGFAIYEPLGAIALRNVDVFSENPAIEDLFPKLDKLLETKSKPEAYRLVNSEGDGFSGLVIDVYKHVIVYQPYLQFWAPFIEAIDQYLRTKISIQGSVIKNPKENGKIIFGECVEPVSFRENGLTYLAYPLTGQKTGFYLDLKKLREYLTKVSLNKKILNTFANNGALTLICKKFGASSVTSMEASEKCIDQAKTLFQANESVLDESQWITGDVFELISKLETTYDLIILDPPQLTHAKNSMHQAWEAVRNLLNESKKKTSEIIYINCTSRLLKEDFLKLFKELKLEVLKTGGLPGDHTINAKFPEGQYLNWWHLRKEI